MARLRKEKIDAVLADHARGYTVMEIAERAQVHRNTVAKLLRPAEPKAVEAESIGSRTAATWAALARVTLLVDCPKCGVQLPLLTHQPNLVWQGVPCGHALRCPCGTWQYHGVPGLSGPFARAKAAMLQTMPK